MSTVGNIEKLPVSWPFGTFFGTALGWMVGRQEMHHPQSRKKCSFYRFCHLVVHRGHLSRQKETVYSLQLCCSIFVRRNDQMYVVHVLAIYCVLLLEGLLFTTKGGKNHATRIHCVFFLPPIWRSQAQVNLDHFSKVSGCFQSPKTNENTPPALEVQPLYSIYRLVEEPPFFQISFKLSSSTRKQIIFSKCFLTSMALDYTFRSIHDVVYLKNYTVTILTININNIHVGTSTVPIFMNPMRIIQPDHLTSWDPNRRCKGLSVDTRWCSGHRGERFRG